MLKHRTLSLETFISAIDWDLFHRYFGQLPTQQRPEGWAAFNPDAMQLFLDDPKNAEAAGIIQEDFQRINDIGLEGTGIIVRACQRYGIELAPDESPAQLAMRLFLDHSEAFEFAWSRFLLYNSASRLSIYPLPGVKGLVIGPKQIAAFQEGVQQWFAGLAKGDQCLVRPFDDRGETVILVRHGGYIRTTPFWDGDQIGMNSIRPALEDVLVYDPVKCQLHIKSTLAKDREFYLRLFASRIVGDDTLADRALKAVVFSLGPLQDGSFSFAGGGPITGIELVKVRMKLYGVTSPVIELRADDVRTAFKHDLGSLTLNSGVLLLTRFHFKLLYQREHPSVTFEIEPPSRTDLAQRKHAQVIENYLVAQGVKLQ